jgi:hypothetical protein
MLDRYPVKPVRQERICAGLRWNLVMNRGMRPEKLRLRFQGKGLSYRELEEEHAITTSRQPMSLYGHHVVRTIRGL